MFYVILKRLQDISNQLKIKHKLCLTAVKSAFSARFLNVKPTNGLRKCTCKSILNIQLFKVGSYNNGKYV
jgi:hypothetical protein